MKNTSKRLLSMMLAFVMVLSMVPAITLAVNAATISGLTDTSIGLSGGSSYWTASGNTLNGSVTGSKLFSYYWNASDTLTITNNKSVAATLSFKYSVSGYFSGGYVTVDGTQHSAAVSNVEYSKELAAGETIKIVVSADKSSGTANTMNIAMTEISLIAAGVTSVITTFEAPAAGSYTVAYGSTSTTVAAGTNSQAIENAPTVAYTLTANPGSGNKFVGWYNTTLGKYVSMDSTFTAQYDSPNTLKAIIVPNTTAVFYVGGTYITGFQEAIDYATAGGHSQITLHMNGTVPAGNYTLPAGLTLLLPRDSAYTAMGANPTVTTSATTPSAYRTLTFADGANLTVNGSIECEAELTTMQGATSTRPHGGRPSGPYGAIYMSPNSNITLNSGANMYVWGYVYGDGTVTALSGSKVYESMQVTDFLGGSNLSNFVDSSTSSDSDGDGNAANDYIKSFFTSQYYVQNIEVALTINAGATEYIFASMTVSSTNISAPPVEFIGANGMFRPQNGSVTKDYDPSTDRLIVDIDGDATIKSIVIDMSDTSYSTILNLVVKTDKFDSANYILSLNSNITINANSGTITMEQDAALAPGVEIYVAEGATLKIAQGDSSNLTLYGSGGHNVYVYDYENWGGYVFGSVELQAASYSPTSGRYKRTAKDLKDVILDVNGTVICDGFLYTTVTTDDNLVPISGGASIISSKKTGSIVMNNGAGTEEFVYRLAWEGSTVSEDVTGVASAWLKNGDGTYLQTAGAEAGAVFEYCADHDCWYTGDASGVVVTDPTCTEGGYTTTTCICGATSVTDQVAALGHSYESVTVEPTCDAKGSVTYTCTVCGHSYTEEIAALGHSWTDATCTAPKTCSVCGTTEGEALGHSYESVVTAPTCTAGGYTTYTCTVCGDSYVADEVDALGHTWNDATCDTAKTCSVCGETEGEALGHSYESVVTAPTCTEGGYTTYTCTVCGDSYVADEVDALGHTWNDATCDTAKTCSVCGVTEGEALGHSYESVVTAPTCTTGGYTTYTCACGDSYVADEVAALGHTWNDATCTTPKTCAVCGETEGEALGHSYESVVTAPTCTAGGYTTYTCTVCGDSYVADEVDALGHASYTYSYASGVHSFTCTLCGETVTMAASDSKKFAINSAAPVLSDDIVMKYSTTVPAGFENAYMVFDFNGESFTISDYEVNATNGRYEFKFPGINPQKMGDNICATLYASVDGVQVSVQIANYSMVKNCDNQLKKSTTDAKTRTMLSDVLMYGEKAQIVTNYKTDVLVTSLLSAASTLTPSTYPESLDASVDMQKRTGTKDSRVQFTGVTLSLGSKMAVRVAVTCTDTSLFTYKVEISGREYTYTGEDLVPVNDGSDGKYYLFFNQMKATEFGNKITFTCWEGDTQISYTIEYSVYTFIYRNMSKVDANTQELLKAIYNYGESVK